MRLHKIAENEELRKAKEAPIEELKTELSQIESGIAVIEKEIKELEKNNSYMEIQIKCNDVSEKIAALKKEEKDNNDKITELLSSCNLEEHNIQDMEERLKYINLSKEDKEKNIGSLKSLLRDSQLVSGRAGFGTQAVWLQSPGS